MLGLPTISLPNARAVTERRAAGAVPVPESETRCGVPGASSYMSSSPVWGPVVVGENTTAIPHDMLGEKVPAQWLSRPKPAVAEMLETLRVALPVFVSVTDW